MPVPLKIPKTNGQPDEVSSWRLKVSYWYVINKLQLKQGLMVFLIALSVVFYSYAGYRLVVILFIQDKDFQQAVSYLPQDLINYSYFRQVNKPKDLAIVGFDIIASSDQRYDYIVKVRNANLNFVASPVVFQLVEGGRVLAEKTGFVYPGEEKYVGFFGQVPASAGGAAVKIARVGWRRYSGFADFSAPRLRFETSEIKFKSGQESGIRGQLPVSTLNFKITNNSAYGYWHVGVYLVLFNGSSAVGANYILLDQFESGSTKDVEMKWYEPLAGVAQIQILPEVDILDPAVYMPVR